MKRINRHKFLRRLGLGVATLPFVFSSCSVERDEKPGGPAIHTEKRYKWKMVTTWPPNFPILGTGCTRFADRIRQLSRGRIEIKVYGGGELVPALESFDAVRTGTIEMGSGASYYWAGKAPAAQFFGSVPFGMNAQMVNSWLLSGGGMDLWEEVYRDFSLIPLAGGNTGVQMGGWFNRAIDTIEDLQGLKMRIPGLGGQVLGKAGGTAVLVAGGEIFTNLERGVIDATEWIGPYHDYLMGFHNIAKYCYYPGWHETGTILEFFINKDKMDALPEDLQGIIRAAAAESNQWMLAEFEAKNAEYLTRLKQESDAEFRAFPEEVLNILREYTKEVLVELVSSDPLSKKVYASYKSFMDRAQDWSELTEKSYYRNII